MKIHYFQRYHDKENVATANTMLLLSRLYQYSSDRFFRFLKSEFFSDSFEPEITFNLQEKSTDSVPDAVIRQESFKIVVETKMSDWFQPEQLARHLKSFHGEQYKVLLTLAPELMAKDKKQEFDAGLKEYNSKQQLPVIHINTTFEAVANAIQDVIDDKDYEMQEVLDDYLDYCYRDHLITVSDSWRYMRMRLSGTTFDFNVKENLYYDNAEHGFKAHDYLGLYRDKSVRKIGRICARILAVEDKDGKMNYEAEFGELTEARKQAIVRAGSDAEKYGYDIKTIKHRYFFVESFMDTDFKKITPRAPMGARNFDLTQILGTEMLPEVNKIAELLKVHTWN